MTLLKLLKLRTILIASALLSLAGIVEYVVIVRTLSVSTSTQHSSQWTTSLQELSHGKHHQDHDMEEAAKEEEWQRVDLRESGLPPQGQMQSIHKKGLERIGMEGMRSAQSRLSDTIQGMGGERMSDSRVRLDGFYEKRDSLLKHLDSKVAALDAIRERMDARSDYYPSRDRDRETPEYHRDGGDSSHGVGGSNHSGGNSNIYREQFTDKKIHRWEENHRTESDFKEDLKLDHQEQLDHRRGSDFKELDPQGQLDHRRGSNFGGDLNLDPQGELDHWRDLNYRLDALEYPTDTDPEVLVENDTSLESRRLTPMEAAGNDIMITLRTVKRYHDKRLPLLFRTWLSKVNHSNVFLMTDDRDKVWQKKVWKTGM